MAPEEVQAKMQEIILGKLEIGELITLDDFARANLPMQDVPAQFKRVLRTVQNSMAMDLT